MSEAGHGEWFADSDGQWTWRQPDGSRWRQGPDGGWHEFAVSVAMVESLPHPGPPPGFASNRLSGGAPSMVAGSLPGSGHDGLLNHDGAVHLDSHQDGVIHLDSHQAPRVKKETSAMAVWALVLAILNLCWVGAVLGIIIGFEALHHIRHSHGTLRGKTPAILAILVGLGWFATIPIVVVPFGISAYHGARTTASDTASKEELRAALGGVNEVFGLSHTYAGISASSIPIKIPLVHLSSTCQYGDVCITSGSGFGYTYVQMCKTTSHHVWMISQTSGNPAWYGETSGSCPLLGDPGTAANQPSQAGEWRQGGFPPPTFDFTFLGHHYHVKL